MQWLIHVKTPGQTCLQNTELTLEMFSKISTCSCHQVPNELSNLLAQVATCSTQTANQNTNVPAEVCKVPIKRTSGLTVIYTNVAYIYQKLITLKRWYPLGIFIAEASSFAGYTLNWRTIIKPDCRRQALPLKYRVCFFLIFSVKLWLAFPRLCFSSGTESKLHFEGNYSSCKKPCATK